MGADVELVEVVACAIGYTQIDARRVTFEELLPGVIAGRWDRHMGKPPRAGRRKSPTNCCNFDGVASALVRQWGGVRPMPAQQRYGKDGSSVHA